MRTLFLLFALAITPSLVLADRKIYPAAVCQFWPGENANQSVNGDRVTGAGQSAMSVSQFGHVVNKNTSNKKILGLVCPLIRDNHNKDFKGVFVQGFTGNCHSHSDEETPGAVCHSNNRAKSTCVVRSRTALGVVRETSTKTFRRVDENRPGPATNLTVGWSGPELEVLNRQAAVFVFCELGRDMRIDGITAEEDS